MQAHDQQVKGGEEPFYCQALLADRQVRSIQALGLGYSLGEAQLLREEYDIARDVQMFSVDPSWRPSL